MFIVGNTMDVSRENLDKLSSVITTIKNSVILIYCGDILDKSGLNKNPQAKDSTFIRSLLDVGKENKNVSVYFVAGDKDWNNSGKNGWKDVKKLEAFINGIAQKEIFIPGKGCPGPEVMDFGNNLEIVFLNTQWLIHPYERPYAPDDDCKALTEQQFNELLEDVIDEAKEKNLLVIGHHPVWSYGKYGGRITLKDHFSPPVLGSFKAAYHQNIGSSKDMAYPSYQNFVKEMRYLMEDYSPFIYASAHENNMQVIEFENSYQVISGSIEKKVAAGKAKNTVFKSNKNGFINLNYYANGKVMMNAFEWNGNNNPEIISKELYQSACESDDSGAPVNTRCTPCKEVIKPALIIDNHFSDSMGTAVAGKEYKAGIIKKLFLGTLHRTSWTAEIKIPFLNLDTAKGGLTATGKGGGRQTHSLSFNGADNKSYVFRSVDKDPVRALSPVLRKTFVAGLTRQFTATQHPYGALPVSYLLDATTIYHAKPELYILPDDPKLGMFQKEFGDMLGMLEEKPTQAEDNHAATFNADEVIRSYALFKKLYKNHDNRVDEKAFLKARIFDIWIGDWGRHEDNWKWAGFNDGDKTKYFPIPRDRDHAFSSWNGLLPYLVSRKWALPNAENFGKHFHDIRSLTYPARHLDRFLLTSLQKEEWLALATEMQNLMTDAVIDSAIQRFPEEVIPLSGNTIAKKLKTRRDELPHAVKKYYDLLSEKVSVTGSNKAERFLIERMPDNTVDVTMTDKQYTSDTLYHRKFFPRETEYINVYGLDGDDEFIITGKARHSIHVRIFEGKGDDVISNTSTVSGSAKVTRIYEYKNAKKNLITKGEDSKVIFSDDKSLVEYNRQPVHYDTYLPLPLIYYTKEDGVEFGLGVSYVFHRFGEEGYANKLKISDRFSTEGNVQVKITDEFHHLFGKWDLLLSGEMAQPYPASYYYGAGNETLRNLSLPGEYYRTRISGYNAFTGLQKVFWRKSSFNFGVGYESNDATLFADHFLATDQEVFGKNNLDFFAATTTLDIDFRDNAIVPKHGVRFFAKQTYSHFNVSDDKDFSNSDVSLEFYQSSRSLLPITLGIKGGFENATGDIPFYKLNTLGRTTGLRGYVRDRFSGNTTAYVNTQLSIEFGTLNTSFLPLTYGVYGFYDAGRVWVPNESSDKIHAGYGGGIYITPLLDIFTTRVSIAFSDEEKKGLFEAGLGIHF